MAPLKDKLRFLRESLGMNQLQAAAALGFKSGTYSSYENGTVPKTETLADIARFYDVSVDYLLGLSNERKPAAGKLADGFAKLLSVCPDSPLNPIDMAAFLRSATAYCRAGQPAGPSPLEALHGFLVGLSAAMDAATASDVPELLSNVNAAVVSALNSSTMMTDYYKRLNTNV